MDKSALSSFLENGDKDSFTKIFDAYFAPLVAFIIQFTHDRSEAEDIAQQSFMILWEKRAGLRVNTSLKSYVFSIAHNLFIDRYRKSRQMNNYVEGLKDEALYEITHETDEELAEQLKFLDKAIQELPPKCKKIFILNKKEGLPYKAIAEQLGISVKTVEVQLRIALIKIRERFKNNSFILYICMRLGVIRC